MKLCCKDWDFPDHVFSFLFLNPLQLIKQTLKIIRWLRRIRSSQIKSSSNFPCIKIPPSSSFYCTKTPQIHMASKWLWVYISPLLVNIKESPRVTTNDIDLSLTELGKFILSAVMDEKGIDSTEKSVLHIRYETSPKKKILSKVLKLCSPSRLFLSICVQWVGVIN